MQRGLISLCRDLFQYVSGGVECDKSDLAKVEEGNCARCCSRVQIDSIKKNSGGGAAVRDLIKIEEKISRRDAEPAEKEMRFPPSFTREGREGAASECVIASEAATKLTAAGSFKAVEYHPARQEFLPAARRRRTE